jgi:hypothetical protein
VRVAGDAAGLGQVTYEAIVDLAEASLSLSAAKAGAGGAWTVDWSIFDGGPGYTIVFLADTDAEGFDGRVIGEVVTTGASGSFTWNGDGVRAGQLPRLRRGDRAGRRAGAVLCAGQPGRGGPHGGPGRQPVRRRRPAADRFGRPQPRGLGDECGRGRRIGRGGHARPAPPGFTLAPSAPATFRLDGGTIVATVGDVAGGGTADLLLPLVRSGSLSSGLATFGATASALTFDPGPDDNVAKVSLPVDLAPPPGFDLRVERAGIDQAAPIGQPVTYSFTLTNTGVSTAASFQVIETPRNANVVSAKVVSSNAGSAFASADTFNDRVSLGGTVLEPGDTVKVEVVIVPFGTAAVVAIAQASGRHPARPRRTAPTTPRWMSSRSHGLRTHAGRPVRDGLGQRAGREPSFTLRIAVLNGGPGVASDVAVRLDLPPGVVVTGSFAVQGCSTRRRGLDAAAICARLNRELVVTLDGRNATGGRGDGRDPADGRAGSDSTPATASRARTTRRRSPSASRRRHQPWWHPGNDTLSGGPGNDTIAGRAGDDLITGLGRHDLLEGERRATTTIEGAAAPTPSAAARRQTAWPTSRAPSSRAAGGRDTLVLGGPADLRLQSSNQDASGLSQVCRRSRTSMRPASSAGVACEPGAAPRRTAGRRRRQRHPARRRRRRTP